MKSCTVLDAKGEIVAGPFDDVLDGCDAIKLAPAGSKLVSDEGVVLRFGGGQVIGDPDKPKQAWRLRPRKKKRGG